MEAIYEPKTDAAQLIWTAKPLKVWAGRGNARACLFLPHGQESY